MGTTCTGCHFAVPYIVKKKIITIIFKITIIIKAQIKTKKKNNNNDDMNNNSCNKIKDNDVLHSMNKLCFHSRKLVSGI